LIDSTLYQVCLWGIFALAPITLVFLLFFAAPYGRHTKDGFGPAVPARLAWVLMESPAVFGFAAFFFMGADPFSAVPLALFALWQLHYVDRTLLYPLRIRPGARATPLLVVASGFGFQMVNVYLNGSYIAAGSYPAAWLTDPRLPVGVALFLVGFVINRWADRVLRNLRAPGETGYKIPRGGLYELVACPNYFGELLEWVGWAVATWSLAGLSFAVFTAANLIPRAVANRRWYRERFPEYPASRRALIPYLL